MKQFALFIGAMMLLNGCNKEERFDGPNSFQDSFEAYTTLENLLVPDDELWSFTQLTKTGNNISVDTTRSWSGNKALKFVAARSDDEGASKASIAKQNMAFWEGETVWLTARIFIEESNSLEWLFLMDLEEQTAIGAGPGMRLALVDDKLRVEYKFNEDDITQPLGEEIDFPRNQWVYLGWAVTLSTKEEGSVRVYQDNQLLIDKTGVRTLPKDLLYFQQGTKGMYSSCEVGITANSSDRDLTIWVDDVAFKKIN